MPRSAKFDFSIFGVEGSLRVDLFDKFRNPEAAAIRRREADDQELLAIARTHPETLTEEELNRAERFYQLELTRRQAELVQLQTQNARADLFNNVRAAKVQEYLAEIEALNVTVEGGLRSIVPEPGEDPELVMEAWRIFCARRRGGGSRFG